MLSDFLFDYVFTSLEIFFFYMIGCRVYHTKLFRACPILLALVDSFFCSIFEALFPDTILSILLGSIVTVAFFCFCFQKPVYQIILLYVLEYLCLFTIEFVPLIVFTVLIPVETDYIPIIGMGVMFLVTLLICRFLPLNKISKLIDSTNRVLEWLIIDSLLVGLSVAAFMHANQNYSLEFLFIIPLILAILVISNVELILTQKTTQRQKQKLDSYEKYIPIIEQLIDAIRQRQHDYNNQLQSLRSLAYACTDYESLRSALLLNSEGYINNLNPFEALLKINMHLLSGLIINACQRIMDGGMQYNLDLKDYTFDSACAEYDLADQISILIDNAIEASHSGDTIYISLKQLNDKVQFTISNPGPKLSGELMELLFKKGRTTKPSPVGHGLGLYKLNCFVNDHSGRLLVSNEQRKQVCYITFTLEL